MSAASNFGSTYFKRKLSAPRRVFTQASYSQYGPTLEVFQYSDYNKTMIFFKNAGQ